jgi:hypothetical protein
MGNAAVSSVPADRQAGNGNSIARAMRDRH